MKGLIRKGLVAVTSLFLFSNMTMFRVSAAEEQMQEEELTVIENVDEEGENFNPSADLDGKKQFLTFRTADNQTYHLVVTYQGNSHQAQLLKNVNEEDMEAIDQASNSENETKIVETEEIEESEETSGEKDIEEEDLNEPNQSSMSWILSVGVALVVGGYGFYKLRKTDSDDYND